MVGLLDIAEIEDGEVTVTVKNNPLSIKGLSVREIKRLLRQFPELDKALSGEAGSTGASFLEAFPKAMEELAIMGTFHENDEKREAAREAFQNFKLHEQLAVLEGILANTFGEHWDPLVEKAKAWLANIVNPVSSVPDVPGMAPPMASLKDWRNSLRSKVTDQDLFGTSVPGNSPRMPS